MSADNCIAIAQFGPDSYRVAHASMTMLLDLREYENDLSKKIESICWLFRKSPLFTTKEEALEHARELYEHIDIVEYGITELESLLPEIAGKLSYTSFDNASHRNYGSKRSKNV